MRVTWDPQRLVNAFTAVLVGFGLLARPSGIVGLAQSNQEAVDGARLMRGAVDLHYHVDPGYSDLGHLREARAAGIRTLVLKNHSETLSTAGARI
jgi:hypothetical protein